MSFNKSWVAAVTAHDYSGERVEAIADTDKAIAEIEQALKADHN